MLDACHDPEGQTCWEGKPMSSMDTLGTERVYADWLPDGWKECKAAHYLEYIFREAEIACSDASLHLWVGNELGIDLPHFYCHCLAYQYEQLDLLR